MNQYMIVCSTKDRMGIVAAVAQQISALQGDIADLSQTVLRGYFTMILLATFPSDVTTALIKERLQTISAMSTPALEIVVLPIDTPATIDQPISPENIYVLTASGADRIGFVAIVAAFCAENEMNILDLATSVDAGQYRMVLQVDLSRCASLATVQRGLKQFAQKQAMHLVLQHNDIFQAIHEINMPS